VDATELLHHTIGLTTVRGRAVARLIYPLNPIFTDAISGHKTSLLRSSRLSDLDQRIAVNMLSIRQPMLNHMPASVA